MIVEPVTETILLVNDDVIVRTALAHYLRDCGYRVVEAVNADEALAVLSHPNVKIDVVFSDLRMPGSLDGFGLSRWVRNHRPEVDMILAATDDRAADAAADVCAAGTLPKPYDPQGLLDRIKRLRAARDHQR